MGSFTGYTCFQFFLEVSSRYRSCIFFSFAKVSTKVSMKVSTKVSMIQVSMIQYRVSQVGGFTIMMRTSAEACVVETDKSLQGRRRTAKKNAVHVQTVPVYQQHRKLHPSALVYPATLFPP